MNTKEQRDRLVTRRADMKHLLNMEMRNRMVPTSAAVRINKEIQAIQKQIDAIDREAAERLRINSAPIDEVLQIVAIPLLADCMNDPDRWDEGKEDRETYLRENDLGGWKRFVS